MKYYCCPNCGRCYEVTPVRYDLTKEAEKRMNDLVKVWAKDGDKLCCQTNYDEWRIKKLRK